MGPFFGFLLKSVRTQMKLRFHVIWLVNHHFLLAGRQLDPLGSRHRGLLSLMRRHVEKLSAEQKLRLRRYLATQPVLDIIYEFKQKLCRFLLIKHRILCQCRPLIPLCSKPLANCSKTAWSRSKPSARPPLDLR